MQRELACLNSSSLMRLRSGQVLFKLAASQNSDIEKSSKFNLIVSAFSTCGFKLRTQYLNNKSIEEERRCNTRGGKASESLSEENCPLEALRVFFLL